MYWLAVGTVLSMIVGFMVWYAKFRVRRNTVDRWEKKLGTQEAVKLLAAVDAVEREGKRRPLSLMRPKRH